MKTNVKGYIGLFSGIIALVLILIAMVLPTNPINGTSIALHGTVNIVISYIAAALGVVAIIFGVLSRKGKGTEKGPRKAGVIIGIFAVIFAFISVGICSMTKEMVDYANGKPGSAFSQLDDKSRQDIDKAINELKQATATTK